MTQDYSQTGTAAVGSTYTSVYLDQPDDYEDIREALGLDADDTTTLSAERIERRMFLPRVETAMAAVLTDCEVAFGDDDDDDEAIRESVVYWAASLLAERWLARKQGSIVKSQSTGPFSVTYEGGQDWQREARRLRYLAADAMSGVCDDAVAAIAGFFFAKVDDWDDSEPGDDTGDV